MRTIALFALLLLTLNVSAQRGAYDYRTRNYDQYDTTERIAIGISPLALLDTYNGSSYKGGISIKPIKSLRITADLGTYSPQLIRKLSFWDYLKGYNFRTSVGYYFFMMGDLSLGLDYQYKKQNFNYTDTVPNQPSFAAHVDKFVHVFNIYGSYDIDLAVNLYLEIRLNLGIRYREITNDQSDQLDDSVIWYDSYSGRITQGKNFIPNINLAVRLNYVLWGWIISCL